jgi:hypothetical protein
MKVNALNGLITGTVPAGTSPEKFAEVVKYDVKRFNGEQLQQVAKWLQANAVPPSFVEIIKHRVQITRDDAVLAGAKNRAEFCEGILKYLDGETEIQPPGMPRWIQSIEIDGVSVGHFITLNQQEGPEGTETVQFRLMEEPHAGEILNGTGTLKDGILVLYAENVTDNYGDPYLASRAVEQTEEVPEEVAA